MLLLNVILLVVWVMLVVWHGSLLYGYMYGKTLAMPVFSVLSLIAGAAFISYSLSRIIELA